MASSTTRQPAEHPSSGTAKQPGVQEGGQGRAASAQRPSVRVSIHPRRATTKCPLTWCPPTVWRWDTCSDQRDTRAPSLPSRSWSPGRRRVADAAATE
eukprot:13410887-Alexandrium_andersonii.AAC.1